MNNLSPETVKINNENDLSKQSFSTDRTRIQEDNLNENDTFIDRYNAEGKSKASEFCVKTIMAIIATIILSTNYNILGGGSYSIDTLKARIELPYLIDVEWTSAGQCPQDYTQMTPGIFEKTLEGCSCRYIDYSNSDQASRRILKELKLNESVESTQKITKKNNHSTFYDLQKFKLKNETTNNLIHEKGNSHHINILEFNARFLPDFSDGGPGELSDKETGEFSDGGPGELSDGGPGELSDGGPGEPSDGGPGELSDGGPGEPSDGAPGGASDYVYDKNFVFDPQLSYYYYFTYYKIQEEISEYTDYFSNFDQVYQDYQAEWKSNTQSYNDYWGNYDWQASTSVGADVETYYSSLYNSSESYDFSQYETFYADPVMDEFYKTNYGDKGYDYTSQYKTQGYPLTDYDYKYLNGYNYIFQGSCLDLLPNPQEFNCIPQKSENARLLPLFFDNKNVLCLKKGKENQNTLSMINGILNLGDEQNDVCLQANAVNCGLFCVPSGEECPIIYFGVAPKGDIMNDVARGLGSPHAEFIKENLEFQVGYDENKMTLLVDIFIIKSSSYDSDYVKKNKSIRQYFDSLPIIDLKIGENHICEHTDSKSLGNFHPLFVKKNCPQDLRYSAVKINQASPNDFISLNSILSFNSGANLLITMPDMVDAGRESKWYILEATAFQRYFMNCVISLNNGQFLKKGKKVEILQNNIDFFDSFTKDYKSIRNLVLGNLVITIINCIFLVLFSVWVVIGEIFLGFTVKFLPGTKERKREIVQLIAEAFDLITEIIMLFLSVISYVILKNSKGKVETAISTGCFEGYTLTELTLFVGVLDNFIMSGVQAIVIFSCRFALAIALNALKIYRDRRFAQSTTGKILPEKTAVQILTIIKQQ